MTMAQVTSGVVVDRQAQDWLAHPLAAGPFGGSHGGVIAACLPTAISAQPEAHAQGLALLHVQLLRAPELRPFPIDVETIRTERNTATLSATHHQRGKAMGNAGHTRIRSICLLTAAEFPS